MPPCHDHAFTVPQPARPRRADRRQPPQLAQGRPRRARRADAARPASRSRPRQLRPERPGKGKSVILLWMAGGPSHIDTWDPKPDRPPENRGPFGVIRDQAARRPRLRAPAEAGGDARPVHASSARSTARHSNHEPNTVLQTGNLRRRAADQPARPRSYPAIGSLVAKHHGAEPPGDAALRRVHEVARRTSPSPATSASSTTRSSPTRPRGCRSTTYVGNDTGQLTGGRPVPAARGPDAGPRSSDRRVAAAELRPAARATSTAPASMAALDRYGQQAVEMLARRPGPATRFDLSREPAAIARPLRQAPLVPAGAAGPAAGRGGRRVRDARPELPHRLRHLGHARRQHPALRRHQQGPRAAAAAVRPPASRRWSATWTSAACSTTCW